MRDVLAIVAKCLPGGALVLVFAALSETLEPKRFAGILGAAPSARRDVHRRRGLQRVVVRRLTEDRR